MDPGLQIGLTPGLPYVQSETGALALPLRPRLMIDTAASAPPSPAWSRPFTYDERL